MNIKQEKTFSSSQEKQLLKKSAHHLKPVVQIGKKGLTESLMKEIRDALLSHELIKIQFLSQNKEDILNHTKSIIDYTGASIIMMRGKILTIFLKGQEKQDH
jgi:RNA-binding protein